MGPRGYGACVAVIATLLSAGTFVRPATADDGEVCANESGDIAIAACTRAIESGKYKGKSLAIKYLNRGAEWKLKKNLERALADYEAAIRLDRDNAEAYYNTCIVYKEKEDYDRALTNCNKAIAIGAPSNSLSTTTSSPSSLTHNQSASDYFTVRGDVYSRKKDYSRAIADYSKAVQLDPKNVSALKGRGRAYEAQGDNKRAEADFKAANAH